MSQVSVTTAAVTIIAGIDSWRHIVIVNMDATNPIYIEVGATATAAGSLRIAAGQSSPLIPLPPNTIVSAIATGASVDTRFLAV